LVADRVWRAFWKDQGHPLELLTGLVRESLGAGPIPTSFIAHDGDTFLGTVAVIACDEESRPQYTPWIAALWVEPEYRQRGIGAALVERASGFAFSIDVKRVYLLTRERRRAFYEKLGWLVLEADVPEAGLNVLFREAPAISP
jgi:GNAT superfamily N-acetyltransferase